METKFNFKSAICTSREQSEKVLALGLKKETADMWYPHFASTCPIPLVDETLASDDIPAWSLHRLLCLYNVHYLEFMGEKEITSAYDIVIDAITQAIEGGYFNEKYLV